jgi:hypothetical protein
MNIDQLKKGIILRFKNHKNRGLVNSPLFYVRGVIDNLPIILDCIITQDGNVLLNDKIIDISNYADDLVIISIEGFLQNKFEFENNSIIDFRNEKFNNGIIRNIDIVNKLLTVEVKNEDTFDYEEIPVKFEDVDIVYPEFTYNFRHNFKKLLK